MNTIIDQLIMKVTEEFSTNQKLKRDVIDPLINYMSKRMLPYILFSIFFVSVCVIFLTIVCIYIYLRMCSLSFDKTCTPSIGIQTVVV